MMLNLEHNYFILTITHLCQKLYLSNLTETPNEENIIPTGYFGYDCDNGNLVLPGGKQRRDCWSKILTKH